MSDARDPFRLGWDACCNGESRERVSQVGQKALEGYDAYDARYLTLPEPERLKS